MVLTYGILITSMLCYEFISRADGGKTPQDFIFSLLLFWKKKEKKEILLHFCKSLLDNMGNVAATSILVTMEKNKLFMDCYLFFFQTFSHCHPTFSHPHHILWHCACSFSELIFMKQTLFSSSVAHLTFCFLLLHIFLNLVAFFLTSMSKETDLCCG